MLEIEMMLIFMYSMSKSYVNFLLNKNLTFEEFGNYSCFPKLEFLGFF